MLLNVTEIMVAAAQVRRQAVLTEPPYSTQQIVDACYPNVLVTGDHLPTGVAEMVITQGGQQTIVYNRRMPIPTQRVAIAHALGHLVFDDPIGDRHRYSTKYDATEAVERRADLFAAELLVPLSDIDPAVGTDLFPQDSLDKRIFSDLVDQCASWFSVPAGFIRWRLWDLMHLRRTNFFLRDNSIL